MMGLSLPLRSIGTALVKERIIPARDTFMMTMSNSGSNSDDDGNYVSTVAVDIVVAEKFKKWIHNSLENLNNTNNNNNNSLEYMYTLSLTKRHELLTQLSSHL